MPGFWGMNGVEKKKTPVPPLPGPSPCARASLGLPPPLPGPSPAARAAAAANAAAAAQPSAGNAIAEALDIVVTGEVGGIRLGVITLDKPAQRRDIYICCQCGEQDSAVVLDKLTGRAHCVACWDLLEDTIEELAAIRISASCKYPAEDIWEECCEDCGKRDKKGAVDEDDGNFYCSECWAFGAGMDAEVPKVRNDLGGGVCARMSVCEECGRVGLGEVDESDSLFYCNDCWVEIGLAPTTPASAKKGANVLATQPWTVHCAVQGAAEDAKREAGDAVNVHADTPPPLPGPSPAARAAKLRLHLAPSNLNEHYSVEPRTYPSSTNNLSAVTSAPDASAPPSAAAASRSNEKRPVREHLREREECNGGTEEMAEQRRLRVERERMKEMEKREREGEQTKAQERERAKERQRLERERQKEWKQWEQARKREEQLKREENRRKEAEDRKREEAKWREEQQEQQRRRIEKDHQPPPPERLPNSHNGRGGGGGPVAAANRTDDARNQFASPSRGGGGGGGGGILNVSSASGAQVNTKMQEPKLYSLHHSQMPRQEQQLHSSIKLEPAQVDTCKHKSEGREDVCSTQVTGIEVTSIEVTGIEVTDETSCGGMGKKGGMKMGVKTVETGGMPQGVMKQGVMTLNPAFAIHYNSTHASPPQFRSEGGGQSIESGAKSGRAVAGAVAGAANTSINPTNSSSNASPVSISMVVAAVDETQEDEKQQVLSSAKAAKKAKSSRAGGILQPLKGLRRVLTGGYRSGGYRAASSSPALAATTDAPSAVVKGQSGEKVEEQDTASEAGHTGGRDALAQHLAKRRLRGREPEYTAPNLTEHREPMSPGEKTRMWTEDILPAFESHLRKKWVHSLWRSGIPVPLRPRVWPLAIGNRLCLTSGDYATTLHSVLCGAVPVKGIELISLDLPRTRLKGSVLSRESMLQLGNLLRAVSALRPAQGYVQGMSFLGAFLLSLMNVQEAFVCLGNLLGLRYFPDFLSMRAAAIEERYSVFWQVLAVESSQLATHMSNIGFTPGLIITDWWLTLFSRFFSPDIVGRLWDCFLLEGEPLLFRAAVGFFKTLENRLMGQPLEVCLDVINKAGDEATQESLFQAIAEVSSNIKSIRLLLDAATFQHLGHSNGFELATGS